MDTRFQKSRIGIDPGLSGGLALILSDGRVKTLAMPVIKVKQKSGRIKIILDSKTILRFLRYLPPFSFCAIEEQIAVRGQHVMAGFTLAKNYGMLIMALEAMRVNYIEVTALDWHKYFGIINHIKKSDKKAEDNKTTKEQALEIAYRLFPDTVLYANTKSKKTHAGIVDALLIAKYAEALESIN